jgi:general L-amino acid transport system permease protein
MAIGYPDLMSTANTIINQTGQAVEIIALTMGIYFALSLLITTFLNHRNKKILQNMGR